MTQAPPDTEKAYTLQEAAEIVGREYGYVCTVVKDLELGHLEERRPGSKGPQRRLLSPFDLQRLKDHFAGKQEVPRRMGSYRFKLIKAVKGQSVQIKWAEENPDGSWDNHSLTSEDPARPELYDTLQAFADRMAETHRLQVDEDHELAILGLHYQRDRDGFLTSIAFDGRMQLSENAWWPIRSISLSVTDQQAKEGLLNAVQHEAGLYINGARAQMSLEFPRGAGIPAEEEVANR